MLTLRQGSLKNHRPIKTLHFGRTIWTHECERFWLVDSPINRRGSVSCATRTLRSYFCDLSMIKDGRRNSDGDFLSIVVETKLKLGRNLSYMVWFVPLNQKRGWSPSLPSCWMEAVHWLRCTDVEYGRARCEHQQKRKRRKQIGEERRRQGLNSRRAADMWN